MSEEKKTVSGGRTIKWPIFPLYGIDGIGFGATSALGGQIKFVLTDVMMLSLAQVTLFDLVSPIINAILAVFYGIVAAKVRNSKYGGRFFKILVGTGILYCLLHFVRHWDVVAQVLGRSYWIIAAILMSYSVLNIGVSSVAINAMIPKIGKTPQDTVLMAKQRSIYMSVSQLIFAALIPILMAKWADKGYGYTFAVLALITGIVYLIFNVAQAFLIRKYELEAIASDEAAVEDAPVAKREKVKSGDMFKGLIKSPQTLVIMGWIFAQWLTYLYLVTIASYYFIYVAEDLILMSTFFSVGNFAMLGGSYISSYITKAIGLRNTAVICSGTQMVCGFAAFLICQSSPVMMVVFCGILTGAHGIMTPTATGLMADCCVIAENKLHKDQTTFIMGFISSPTSWAPYVYNLVANGILAWAGYSAEVAITPELKAKLAFLLLPVGIFAALGFILVTFLYKGTTTRIANMREENAAYRLAHPEAFAEQ